MRISGVAFRVFRYSGRSLARTGPYSTTKPDQRFTSYAEIPGAESCGKIRVRCRIILASPEDTIRRTSSSVPNVPLPAAHQTLIPFVSRTRISVSYTHLRAHETRHE